MKQKFKQMICIVIVLLITNLVLAQNNPRSFSQNWPANEIETLEINNKFGQVKVTDNGSDRVTIDVLITVDGKDENAVLEKIDVNIARQGNQAFAETKIASNLKTKSKYSIDYTVNIPANKNLKISNKFGSVVLQNLTGTGQIDVAYGNLTAGLMHTSGAYGFSLKLAYGKADIESMHDGKIDISYSKMYIKSAGNLSLISKYSSVNIDNLAMLNLDSKYDTFNFGTIASLVSISKFSNYRIQSLEKMLKLSSDYGSIHITNIPANFEAIDVKSSFAQVSLGIDEKSAYGITAVCDYCSIDYPQNNFTGNRAKENSRQTVTGKILNGDSRQVSVVSRYGNIKLIK